MQNLSQPSKTELRDRAERMRQEALAYQIEHAGADDSENALYGEIDCLVELEILKSLK